MSLKGNLQSVDLANVLQMLSINQKEGALVLFDGDNRKSIYFARDGVSMLSRGRRGQDSLGRILLRYGRITEDALKEALAKQKAEGKRLGEVLQEMGTVSTTDIDDAIRTQIEEEIYNLFIWKEASFEFIEGPPPPEMETVQTRVTFNVNSLIMEAQRRADEWNYIRGLVPSLDEIYRPTEKMGEAVVTDEVFHFPFAPRILERLQTGRLNVSELIEASHAAKFEACKIMANLLEQGAIEPVTISDLQAFAQEASTKGEHPQAAKFLSRIVDLGGATPGVNMSLGYALEAMDEPERASIYFKAAGESYVEGMEPKSAFDAYQRIARALPTDLQAVLQMVEIAFNNPDLLAANRHEVTEAGRILAQCLKELGRLPAAIQVLNSVSHASPQDMPLRNMLVQAYLDSGMANEAMAELESMAEFCTTQKNLEEAIRCLRRVLGMDRTRAGIAKKIEALTRARDSGKRFILRVVAISASVLAVGLGIWGFRYYSGSRFAAEERVRNIISAEFQPTTREFDETEAKFLALFERLKDWKASRADVVRADMEQFLAAVRSLEALSSELGKKALALYLEHGEAGNLPSDFVEVSTNKLKVRLVDVREKRETTCRSIEDGAKGAFVAARREAEKFPLLCITKVEEVLTLLRSVNPGADKIEVLVDGKTEDVEDVLKKLRGYSVQVGEVQEAADRKWSEGDLKESHAVIAGFLGPLFTVTEFAEKLVFQVRVTVLPAHGAIRVVRGIEVEKEPVGSPRDLRFTAAGGITFEVSAPGFRTMSVEIPPLKENFNTETLMTKLPWEYRAVLIKEPVWTVDVGAAGIDAMPVPTPDGQSVLVADRNGWIRLISLKDGTKGPGFDARSVSGFRSSPLVTADSVYAATVDGVVIALDFPALKERWRKESAEGPGEAYGSPVLAGGLLVAAGRGGKVVAFDPATGAMKWEVKLDSGTRQSLLEARGWIVATCEDGRARAISADGTSVVTVLASQNEMPGYPPPRSATLAIGNRILMGLDGTGQKFTLVELPVPGAASPHIGYKWGADSPGSEVAGACLAGEDLFLVFANGIATRLSPRSGPKQSDLRGRALPEKELPVGSPAFLGSLLFVASRTGLSALRPGNLEFVEAWRWAAPEGTLITTGPLAIGNLVLVGSKSGRVYALLQD